LTGPWALDRVHRRSVLDGRLFYAVRRTRVYYSTCRNVLLHRLLQPAVHALQHRYLSRTLITGLFRIGLVVIGGFGTYRLSNPASP
jgi:hypothetical protein